MTDNKNNTAHTLALMEDAERTARINAAILEAIKAEDRANVAAYDSPRVYVDNPRTYETTTLALELSNIEPLYTAARQVIAFRIIDEPEDADRAQTKADAVKEYVAGILEDQDTTNPRTALLVALANAATARVDWSDVAEQIAEQM